MGLVTAIGLLIDDYETWKEGGKSFFDWSAAQVWFDHMSKIFDALKTIVGNFFSADCWKSKTETISNEMSLLDERIQDFLSDSWNNAITEASNKWDELKNTISQKAQEVYDGIISTFVGLSTWFGDLWKSIGDGAMKSLTDIGKAFTQWWNNLINSVKNFGSKAAEKAENMVTDAWDTSVNAVKGLFSWGNKKEDEKAASSLPTTTTNNNQRSNTVYNNNAQVNQTINVNSAKEAKDVASGTNRIYTQPAGAMS